MVSHRRKVTRKPASRITGKLGFKGQQLSFAFPPTLREWCKVGFGGGLVCKLMAGPCLMFLTLALIGRFA